MQVYQFTPGSHTIGPYHDDVLWNKTIVNALPRVSQMQSSYPLPRFCFTFCQMLCFGPRFLATWHPSAML